MIIEILSIGSELLSGKTVNRNATTIAQVLLQHGYKVSRVTALPDTIEVLIDAMRQMLNRADLVIATGGLGPTQDDQTRMAVAQLTQKPLVTDVNTLDALKKRYGSEEGILRHQASFPEGATVLTNPIGTAVGFSIKVGKNLLVALPGVPIEMKVMLQEHVLPLVARTMPKQYEQQALFFCLRREFQFDAYLRKLEKKYSSVEIGICPSYGIVAIYLTTRAKTESVAAVSMLEDVAAEVKNLFPTHCFSSESIQVEIALQRELMKKKKTFATAESCTGGRLASRITALPGISEVFVGGIVAYSNELKEMALNVSRETLISKGAVSRETVVEMTAGALKKTTADYVLTTSGIAGPDGGTLDKPVGTIWVALGCKEKKIYSHCLRLPEKWQRDHMIEYVTTYLFASLWRYLAYQVIPFQEKP